MKFVNEELKYKNKSENKRKFGVSKWQERCLVIRPWKLCSFQRLYRFVLHSKWGNRNSEFTGNVCKEVNDGVFFSLCFIKCIHLNVCKYTYEKLSLQHLLRGTQVLKITVTNYIFEGKYMIMQ